MRGLCWSSERASRAELKNALRHTTKLTRSEPEAPRECCKSESASSAAEPTGVISRAAYTADMNIYRLLILSSSATRMPTSRTLAYAVRCSSRRACATDLFPVSHAPSKTPRREPHVLINTAKISIFLHFPVAFCGLYHSRKNLYRTAASHARKNRRGTASHSRKKALKQRSTVEK